MEATPRETIKALGKVGVFHSWEIEDYDKFVLLVGKERAKAVARLHALHRARLRLGINISETRNILDRHVGKMFVEEVNGQPPRCVILRFPS